MRSWMVLILLMLTATGAWAEETVKVEEVVVTASRLEEPLEETTSDVIVISKEDIEQENVEFLTDSLKRVPELTITQNGGKGKTASLLLRGASSNQTLVMIDGVKVKSTTTGDYDLAGLLVDDIEKIEIVKGPQSTIYGSEAMAGVINIITKKGSGKPKFEVSLEGGAHETYKPSFAVSGGTENVDYRLTASYLKTHGISAAKVGTERDEYRNVTLSGKIGLRISDNAELELSARHYFDTSELDAFNLVDDPNYVQRGHHTVLSGKGKFYIADIWEQVLTLSTVRDDLIGSDPDTPFNNWAIKTSMDTADWQNNLYIHDQYTLTLGAEYRKEDGESAGSFNESIENRALYMNNKVKLLNEALVLNAGLRRDDHETFGKKTTYRLGTLVKLSDAGLRLRAAYGTAFRAPTLNELFYQDPWGSSGNINLRPEKSKSWEAGLEKDLLDEKLTVSVTYFEQDYEDLIQWTQVAPWTWQPRNIAKTEIKGVETSVAYSPIESLSLSAGHTYLDTEDPTTGRKLHLRPYNKATFGVSFTGSRFSALGDFMFVDDRYDQSAGEDIGSYWVVNLSGRYKLNDAITFFARAENLFDEDYEELAGYGTPGTSFYAGVKAEL